MMAPAIASAPSFCPSLQNVPNTPMAQRSQPMIVLFVVQSFLVELFPRVSHSVPTRMLS